MDALDDVRLCRGEQVVVADEIVRPILESLAAVARLVRPVALDRRAHRAVDDHDPLTQSGLQFIGAIRADVRLPVSRLSGM